MANTNKTLELPGLNELKVGTKSLQLSEETAKANPNILRFLLGFIVDVKFRGSRKRAAAALKVYGGRYRTGHADADDGARLTNKTLGQILNDGTDLKFWQLESFAEYLQQPTGCLVMLSRCMSFVRDEKQDRGQEFVAGVRKFADVLDQVVASKSLTEEHLDQITACFAKALQDDELPLWNRPAPKP